MHSPTHHALPASTAPAANSAERSVAGDAAPHRVSVRKTARSFRSSAEAGASGPAYSSDALAVLETSHLRSRSGDCVSTCRDRFRVHLATKRPRRKEKWSEPPCKPGPVSPPRCLGGG